MKLHTRTQSTHNVYLTPSEEFRREYSELSKSLNPTTPVEHAVSYNKLLQFASSCDLKWSALAEIVGKALYPVVAICTFKRDRERLALEFPGLQIESMECKFGSVVGNQSRTLVFVSPPVSVHHREYIRTATCCVSCEVYNLLIEDTIDGFVVDGKADLSHMPLSL